MPKHRTESTSSSDSGPTDRTPVKKTKSEDNDKPEENRWQLDKMRFVSINEFRGVKRIDIREYYEKDGKQLPGKKGISLSLQQFEKLGDIFEEVKKAASN